MLQHALPEDLPVRWPFNLSDLLKQYCSSRWLCSSSSLQQPCCKLKKLKPKSDDTLEEMHFKTHCDECKEAQQSPEYEKVTPTKISKWRFEVQLEGKGTYECSATGLVFEVSDQALVRYSVLSWSEIAKFLPDSWRPAGSIWNVDVVNKDPSALNKDSSVLKFIHFPHSLCLAEPVRELSFRVLHVKDRHADIESTVDFTASHVKWPVSSLSKVGPIIPSSLPAKHHAVVLIYNETNHKYFFDVYLVCNNDSEIKAIAEQVNNSRKNCSRMDKPAPCNSQLVAGKNYHLTSEPEGKVEPSELHFHTDVIGLKRFSEARFDERPPFRLFLMDSDFDKPLWSATIIEEDLKRKEPIIGQKGLVQNRSKPVKKKPSCSNGQGSCPGELSSSPPPKMPKSDHTLDISDLIDHPLPGPSLTKDTASMPVVDRCEEEDCSDSEEMHVKSSCEKCKAAQQSPEYKKVTPTKISKWSFQVQLEGEGTYECSATGLVFEVSEQALVRYSVLTWSEFSKFLHDSWRPAGSIWNVDVVNKHPSALNKDSSVLKFIHFPHSLCLAEPEHEMSFSVLHVKDHHDNIDSKVDFTESHVKWRVSSLSIVGPISPSSLPAKHHAVVLIYNETNHKYFFDVYLVCNNDSEIKAIAEQVNNSRKNCSRMDKPAPCNSQLVAGKNYHLTSEPEGKVEPSELHFHTDVIGLKGFSEARFDERPPFRLFLMDSDCDKPLWSATIIEEDLKRKEPIIGQKGLRSKPVKRKPSCSSRRWSRPGELSSSPPPKMPKSDDTLAEQNTG
ncbi:unnamed protein product [Boreogadus saida]